MSYADSPQEEEEMVLNSIKEGFEWVGPMPASALAQDDPRLPSNGHEMLPALTRLWKKGLVTRSRSRQRGVYLWGLPGKWERTSEHPGYFTNSDFEMGSYNENDPDRTAPRTIKRPPPVGDGPC